METGKKAVGNRYSAYKAEVWNKGRTAQAIERLHQYRVPEKLLESVAEKFAKGRQGEGEFLSAVTAEFLQNRNPHTIHRELEELRATQSKMQQELLWTASRLQHLRNWRSYRVLGYGHWEDFLEKEFALSENVAGLLMMIVGSDRKSSLDTMIQIILKGYVTEPVSNGEQQPQINRKRTKTEKRHAKRSS